MIKDLETAIGYRFHNIQLLQNVLCITKTKIIMVLKGALKSILFIT